MSTLQERGTSGVIRVYQSALFMHARKRDKLSTNAARTSQVTHDQSLSGHGLFRGNRAVSEAFVECSLARRRRVMSKWQERETVPDLYNLFLAAMLFVSPWLFRLTNEPGKVDLWVTSIIIGLVSLAAIIAYRDWEEWLNVLMGLWLIVSPWLLGFPHTR